MRRSVLVSLALGTTLAASGCPPRTPAPQTLAQPAMVAPPAGTKLADVRAGMTQTEVVEVIGAPDDERWYPTGKNWVPWYFGADRERTAYYYESEGRVIFTGRGAQMTVHHVEYDPSEDGQR
jgi:hypothetical protein